MRPTRTETVRKGELMSSKVLSNAVQGRLWFAVTPNVLEFRHFVIHVKNQMEETWRRLMVARVHVYTGVTCSTAYSA